MWRVLIFHDEEKKQQVPIGGRFNKDLIVIFLIQGVSLEGNLFCIFHIPEIQGDELQVDNSIFFTGNRKAISTPFSSTHKLYARKKLALFPLKYRGCRC